MAIVSMQLDPGAVSYTDDQIVGKVNTAAANITRANAVAEAALPVESTTFQVVTQAETTKLAGIETGATADQTGIEMRDLVVALADDTRQILITRPTTGQYRVYAIQKHTDGKTEIERKDTAES